MTLTPGQIATVLRALEEIADADAKAQLGVFSSLSLGAQLDVLHDSAVVGSDMAVHQETGHRAFLLDADQVALLRLRYISRRVHLEIDRREELAIEARKGE